MKKLFVIAVAVLIPLGALAAQDYTSSFKDGKYEGSVTSVRPDINDTKAAMEITHKGNDVVANVNFGNGVTEEWTWNEKTLTKKEYDANGKVTRTYTANATGEATGNTQTYAINCAAAKKKQKSTCDGGVDSRHTWTIASKGNRLNYTVHGASHDDIRNLAAPAIMRDELAFTKVGTIDATSTLATSEKAGITKRRAK